MAGDARPGAQAESDEADVALVPWLLPLGLIFRM